MRKIAQGREGIGFEDYFLREIERFFLFSYFFPNSWVIFFALKQNYVNTTFSVQKTGNFLGWFEVFLLLLKQKGINLNFPVCFYIYFYVKLNKWFWSFE